MGLTGSALFKAVRAVDGDLWFSLRVQTACDIAGVPGSRRAALFIASKFKDKIATPNEEQPDLVDTTTITDADIYAGLEEFFAEHPDELHGVTYTNPAEQ